MTLDAHIVQHLQVLLTTWFIVMLGYTSCPTTTLINRQVIQAINIIIAILVIGLSFHPNFH